MKKYETYKDSDIEWIGEIPEEWKPIRFKYFTDQITMPSDSSIKIALENIESKTGRYIPTDSQFESNGIQFRKDDILYGKLRPYLQKVWLAEFDGNAVGDIFVYRPKSNCNSSYLKYVLLSDNFTSAANGATYGAKMPRVSSEFIGDAFWFLPTLKEQKYIASYLDYNLGQIDASVSAINAQIDDLKAFRQSIISEVVTKGLNPDVKMKDSGIEWIGNIPEHWEVARIKNYFKIISGNGFKIDLQGLIEGDYPFCKVSDLNSEDIYVNTAKNYVSKEIAVKERYNIIPQNSLLFGKIGEALKKNHRKLNSVDCVIDNNCEALSLKIENSINMIFFFYVSKCIDMAWFDNGGTIPSMNNGELISSKFPLPPLGEQKFIAKYIDGKVTNIDASIQSLELQRDDLNALKQSIISEAVTGKIDVREWKQNIEQ